jgi:hypothetical protein
MVRSAFWSLYVWQLLNAMVNSDMCPLYVWQLLHGQVRFLASEFLATALWSGQISGVCMFGNSFMVRSDFWPLYVWQLLYGLVPSQVKLLCQHQSIIQPVRC